MEQGLQLIMQLLVKFLLLMLGALQLLGNIQAQAEEPVGERFAVGWMNVVALLREEIEISAPVEDVEFLLVFARAEKVLAETGSSTYHLLKFYLRLDDLEEYKVQNLRHIDARVEHVHRYGYLRHLVFYLEVGDEGRVVLHLVVYQLAVVCATLGIEMAETLHDALRMLVVVGEDDSLAHVLATMYLLSVCHQF